MALRRVLEGQALAAAPHTTKEDPMNVHPHTPITLTLALAQVEQVGQALGRQPYNEVESLVATLRLQTQAQLNNVNPASDTAPAPELKARPFPRTHVSSLEEAKASLREAESHRRSGVGSFDVTPLPEEQVEDDYGAVGSVMTLAMHHLDEALPSGQAVRAAAAFRALAFSVERLGAFLSRRKVL